MKTVALIEASVQPGGRVPAPPPLELVQAFVNTVDREHGPDLFDLPVALTAWTRRRGFAPIAAPEGALAVREALRTLCWANAGEEVDAAAASAVLDAAARTLRVRFGPVRVESADAGDAVAAVLAAAFTAMADGSWRRLKACPGHDCGWAFYDRSVNASATWCSMRVCGNRAKAKAYYRRRR